MSNIDGSKAPFSLRLQFYKLEENRQTLLHIVFTGDKNKLPQDRESLFLANIKSVSAMPEELKDKNTLQFAMKARLKLILAASFFGLIVMLSLHGKNLSSNK